MEALRRLTGTCRPHLVPANRQQTSQSSQRMDTATISRPSSPTVKELVHEIESKQQSRPARSSEETQPPGSTKVCLRPRSISSQASSRAVEVEQVDQMEPKVVAQSEEGSMLGSYLQLPSWSKDLARDFADHFSPTQLGHALDGADSGNEHPEILDTPVTYAHSGFVGRESSITASEDAGQESTDAPIGAADLARVEQSFDVGTLRVQELVHESLETPIDGDGPAPVTRSFGVGSIVIPGSSTTTYLDATNISSPVIFATTDVQNSSNLRTRVNFSDTVEEVMPNECLSLQENSRSSSPALVTAPQTPRRNNLTSLSMDGPSGRRADIIDFAQQSYLPRECNTPPLPECCTPSPRSQTPDEGYYFPVPNKDMSGAKENVRAPRPMGGIGAPAAPTGAPGAPLVSVIPDLPQINLPETNAPNVDLPKVPEVGIPEVGLPQDVTGKLDAPSTPPANQKGGKRFIVKGQKVIRKGRNLILRKPVLAVVVGRQLAKPTADALKLISKGIPLEGVDLGAPAPVPLPVPAAGIPA